MTTIKLKKVLFSIPMSISRPFLAKLGFMYWRTLYFDYRTKRVSNFD